ncbi:hypothetical protein CEUSTIGMA_g8456.t1 [Chlamydomonas eustigma]|uniref:Uncharacterized protein n=1 Tax=Chlamydomonas eustigma TaxID=1157962 RepID=A0A250XD72_9CHLO|nr:hypothetical protein CEUSTIGMA_g8456.t1 [Chlamydomonas eustigma]|eukprot:GAX81021.1 hypothetical protein CEUSTIGMA_g8456.t1 [Chlamydomonas eustigma]
MPESLCSDMHTTNMSEERLKDNFRGTISSYLKTPNLTQRDFSEKISALSTLTVEKEKHLKSIAQVINHLPRSLGRFEELIGSVTMKAKMRFTISFYCRWFCEEVIRAITSISPIWSANIIVFSEGKEPQCLKGAQLCPLGVPIGPPGSRQRLCGSFILILLAIQSARTRYDAGVLGVPIGPQGSRQRLCGSFILILLAIRSARTRYDAGVLGD